MPPDTDTVVAEPQPNPAIPLLRNRNFQALWASRFLAGLGKETAEVAYPLLTLAMTGSATYAGTIGAMQLAAATVMALPGGVLGDRFDRIRLLVVFDLVRAVLLTTFSMLVFTGHASIPVVLAISLCSSACLGLSNPVSLAVVRQLVPPSQVTSAAAQNQIRYFSATAVGSPIAGSLFSIGRGFPFVAEASSYVGSMLLLLSIRRSRPDRATPSGQTRGWRGMAGGFHFIAGEPTIRSMMFWITGFNMAFTHTGAFIALIAVARSRGASSSLIGVMISLAGLSGLFGALVAGPLVKYARPSAIMVTAAWAAPISAVLMAAVPGTLPLGVILGFVYAMLPCINAILFGYLAAAVPDDLQGRVMGAIFFVSWIAQPVGIFGVGAIFDIAGPRWVFLAMAATSAIAALPTLTPRMLRLPRPEEVTAE